MREKERCTPTRSSFSTVGLITGRVFYGFFFFKWSWEFYLFSRITQNNSSRLTMHWFLSRLEIRFIIQKWPLFSGIECLSFFRLHQILCQKLKISLFYVDHHFIISLLPFFIFSEDLYDNFAETAQQTWPARSGRATCLLRPRTSFATTHSSLRVTSISHRPSSRPESMVCNCFPLEIISYYRRLWNRAPFPFHYRHLFELSNFDSWGN